MVNTKQIEAARIISGERRSPEALSWATQVHALKPVQNMLLQGNLAGALEALAGLGSNYPNSSVFACELAALMYTAGQTAAAENLLEKFAAGHPADHRSRNYLGTIHAMQGNLREALPLLSSAIKLNSHDFSTQTNYKFALRHLSGEKKLANPTVPFVIATSIPPRNLEESQQALASWQKLGAEVHSLNTAEEIALLKPHFNFVHFVECRQTAKATFGKDYQYLSSILRHLSGVQHEVCAIFNSDIILDCDRNDMNQLVNAARDSFVFASRLNVDTADAACGRVYERGFDFFIFPKALASRIPQVEYCLGQHWWDYAFPWLARNAGMPLTFCYSPVARHINHAARWNEQFFYDYGWYTARIVSPELAALITESASGHIFGDEYLTSLALSMYSSLVGASRPLHCGSEKMRNVFAPIDGARIAVDLLSTNLCVIGN
ncbi:tetratricopeptide repeat protein [Oleidesulfovibrio sp.]|uniref:tetratricopeptide repeat protein n=1 Tax=Oleidesulfovibrio sp. TaxID=2909707 RepID=UPI003A8785DF